MVTGLDWIAINVERAIGLRPATPAEAELSRILAPGLLADLPDQVVASMRLCDLVGRLA